jgi:hypothetical protein
VEAHITRRSFNKRRFNMSTVMKWLSVLLFTSLISVVAVGRLHATEISRKKEPLMISLKSDQLPPKLRDSELARIIGVLESRTGNHQLPRQAKEKLAAMDTEKRRLIIMLCDRIAMSGDKPGADLALLLATALIALS